MTPALAVEPNALPAVRLIGWFGSRISVAAPSAWQHAKSQNNTSASGYERANPHRGKFLSDAHQNSKAHDTDNETENLWASHSGALA